ncbi:MAG: sulfate adenylyltransferase subunit CysN [Planctomycetaceae bacterium]|nr:sulfate adenylyltransferase subunit CysN [Planctomycetaceae bacterium]
MDVKTLLHQNETKDMLRLVTAGSVDDGKSTLIGRLLYESKGIFEDQLSAVRSASELGGSAGGELDLALVTDGLKSEREQGITIDVAYRYFATPRRKFIIADTPGHEQYTRNMATGASTANLVIILIDAEHGVMTQSKRHAFIAALLGIPHFVVAINKMDLVGYSQDVYRKIVTEFTEFAAKLEVSDLTFIPVSALKGDNVVEPSTNMPWYKGSALLNHLETVHIASDRNLIDLRFPVQYALRPDRTFRGFLGTVASGTVKPGEEIMILPSGVRTRVKSVFGPGGVELNEAFPPLSAGLTLEDEVDVGRGSMIVHVHNVPHVDRTLDAMVVWMSDQPMTPGKPYTIKHTTRLVGGTVSQLRYRVDVNTLHRSDAAELRLNEIGRCLITLAQPVAFDAYNRNRATGAFIIIDRVTNSTVGAGMILDRLPNELLVSDEKKVTAPVSTHVHTQASLIAPAERAERLKHSPATIWLTGLTGAGKTTTAYALERKLFDAGAACVVIDGENARMGFSKDLGFSADDRNENVRRSAEIARLLNDSGLVVIAAFLSPYAAMRETARTIIGADRFLEVFLSAPKDICRQRSPEHLYDLAEAGEVKQFSGVSAPYEAPEAPDLTLRTDQLATQQCVEQIVAMLKAKGVLKK